MFDAVKSFLKFDNQSKTFCNPPAVIIPSMPSKGMTTGEAIVVSSKFEVKSSKPSPNLSSLVGVTMPGQCF